MHPNPAFRSQTTDQNLEFARQRVFAALTVNGDPWPLMAHVPFLLNHTGTSAELHLVRSNPIVSQIDGPTPAVLAIQGPDGYISPDWYGLDHQVPTWNYVAVHLRGRIHRLDQSELLGVLDRISDEMESRLAPKPIWKSQKVNPEALTKMVRMIVPFRIEIEDVAGTWKLAQNKPDNARIAAADKLSEDGFGIEINSLSEMMRNSSKP